MTDDLPAFDDDWVAGARHREPSVSELERSRRKERRAVRLRKAKRLAIGLGAATALIAVAVYVAMTPGNKDHAAGFERLDDRQHVWADPASGDRPTPSHGEDSRLLPPVTPPTSATDYAFTAIRSDGSPVTYDPCRSVDFVINPDGAPSNHSSMVTEALVEASRASGLALRLIGSTDEPPAIDRPHFMPDRYGDRWAPVLIAWTDETVIPDLVGRTAGVGGSAWIEAGSQPAWYVSGILYLDRELGEDPTANRAVLLHELGHVIGLDHVDDPTQVMYPETNVSAGTGRATFESGDLAGLAYLGAGGCAGAL
jgi:hypothetical protein